MPEPPPCRDHPQIQADLQRSLHLGRLKRAVKPNKKSDDWIAIRQQLATWDIAGTAELLMTYPEFLIEAYLSE